jgi:hypothetical protein
MKFRNFLLDLDPSLLLEGDESIMDNTAMYLEIKNILEHMSDDEIDEFGAFLAVEFFDTPEEDINDIYFAIDNVLEMIGELGEENYSTILELLLPDEFEGSDDTETEYIELDYDDSTDSGELEEVVEGVSRVMKVSKLNKKKRKFFKKSAAILRKERAERVKQNRLTKASRRAYRRANVAKLKAYQKSRKTFIKKGRHFVKIRRKGGAEA